MFCIASGLFDIFRKKFTYSANRKIQNAISSYIFNGAARQESLGTLIDFAQGPEAKILVDTLRRQLEPRWSDADHAVRERLTIQIFTCISNDTFLVICAQNSKLFDLLDYHLRACTFIDVVGNQQLFLARRIQNWMNVIVETHTESNLDLRPFVELQKKYSSAWRAIDERQRTSEMLRNSPLNTNVSQTIRNTQRAQPLRSKATSVPTNEIYTAVSDADILCFDILRMLMRPDENGTMIPAAMIQAGKLKLYLARVTALQVQYQETQSQSNFKGKVVDSIQRLEYCISLVNACDVANHEKLSTEIRVDKIELLPPVYQYRM